MHSDKTFDCIPKSYGNYGSNTFKRKKILTAKPIYSGIVVFELSIILMYEKDYEKSQSKLGENNIVTIYGHFFFRN